MIAPEGIWDGGAVHVRGQKIVAVSREPLTVPGAQVMHAAGRYVSPGFVDIHIHGGNGYRFSDCTLEAFEAITRLHARYGVTSLQATPSALPFEAFQPLFATYRAWLREGRGGGSEILGIHLEGPFFSMEQRGAQPPQFIRPPTPEDTRLILDNADIIREMTIAPEVPGALEMIRELASHGIVVAAGHTAAKEPEILRAVEAGLSHVSHIYSGMSSMVRVGPWRVPGMLEVGLTHPALTVEMIADGKHLPPTLMKLVVRARGIDRTAIVSDAIQAAGLPEGTRFLSDGQEVFVEDGVAIMGDRTCFAGSIQPVGRMVHNVIELVGLPLREAVRMATEVPARIIHVDDRKGKLAAGMDADITIFDDEIAFALTMVRGEIVYREGI